VLAFAGLIAANSRQTEARSLERVVTGYCHFGKSSAYGLEDIVHVEVRQPLIKNQQVIVAVVQFLQCGRSAVYRFHAIGSRDEAFHHELA
jgi:hypothetical protein